MGNNGEEHKNFAAARATHLFDQVKDQIKGALDQIAAMRREASAAALQMPEDIRQQIIALRQQLHDKGIPWEAIDATAGLEAPD
ncbi:MAG: hypothetical protein JOZ49_13260 [Mycolicibacterium sp.]|nr:hypothetical protein [Mycolicibacterium sp.]